MLVPVLFCQDAHFNRGPLPTKQGVRKGTTGQKVPLGFLPRDLDPKRICELDDEGSDRLISGFREVICTSPTAYQDEPILGGVFGFRKGHEASRKHTFSWLWCWNRHTWLPASRAKTAMTVARTSTQNATQGGSGTKLGVSKWKPDMSCAS